MILWPLPDQRHLYMLVAGVVLGVLLGPAVLGRVAPQAYDPLFVGSGDTAELTQAREALDKFRNDPDTRIQAIEDSVAKLKLSGVSDVAIDEQVMALQNDFADKERALADTFENERFPVLQRQREHRDKLSGMATVMLLLVFVLFAAESILSPQRDELEQGRATVPPALARLITVRYGLAAGWLMMMLAQPIWLKGIDPIFGGLLLLVVLIAGLIPLGKQADEPTA